MKIYKEGEKSKALCHQCQSSVKTTFRVRNVPFSSGVGQAKDILVAVCDKCNAVVSVPQQSSPRIREQRKGHKIYPIEARVPRHLYDMIIVSYEKLGFSGNDEISPIIKYYLVAMKSKYKKSDFNRLLKSDLFKGKASERVSIKLSEPLFIDFNSMKEKIGISKTDLVKILMLRFYDEIIERPNSKEINNLKNILSVAS